VRVKWKNLNWLAGVVLLGVSGVVSAQAVRSASFEQQTSTADEQMTTIARAVTEIEALRADAQKKNQAMRLSCIEEKLKSARASQIAAKQLRLDFGRFAALNPGYASRTLQRMLDLRLSAEAHEQDARACTDSTNVSFNLEVQVDKRLQGKDPPFATPSFQTSPTFERPPLSSPF
jgi:hypothetical protein